MADGVADLAAFLDRLAPLDGDRDELGRAFAVADDGLRQFDRHGNDRGLDLSPAGIAFRCETGARLAGGDHHVGVVGRGIAIDGDAVERGVGRFLDQLVKQRLGNAGIGGEEAEHGRHVRLDHAGTFGNAGNRDFLAVDLNHARGRLGDRVGGHDSVRGSVPVVALEIGEDGRQASLDALDRQRFENDAGGKRQHLFRRNAEQFTDRFAGLAGGLATGFAGAGVGDTGIDHQRADFLATGKVLTTQLDRRGAEAVLGEHTGYRTTGIKGDQRQVAAVLLADFGFSDAETDTGHGEQLIGGRGSVIDGHGKSSNSIKAPRRVP